MKEKEYFIKREQDDAKGSIKIIKRDFYDDLPRAVCEVLDNISWRWRNYEWFDEAWNKYRDHVINSSASGLGIKAPGFVFNDYIDEQVKQDFLNREQMEVLHSELAVDELMHFNDKHDPKTGQFAKKTDAEKVSNNKEEKKEKPLSDEERMDIEQKKMQKALLYNNTRRAYERSLTRDQEEAEQKQREAQAARDREVVNMINAGKDLSNSLANSIQDKRRGSLRINSKETKFKTDGPYSELSDDELNRRINRMRKEREYGDLTGETQYKETGREKTREYLQTIGSMLGVAASAVSLFLLIKHKKNS